MIILIILSIYFAHFTNFKVFTVTLILLLLMGFEPAPIVQQPKTQALPWPHIWPLTLPSGWADGAGGQGGGAGGQQGGAGSPAGEAQAVRGQCGLPDFFLLVFSLTIFILIFTCYQ